MIKKIIFACGIFSPVFLTGCYTTTDTYYTDPGYTHYRHYHSNRPRVIVAPPPRSNYVPQAVVTRPPNYRPQAVIRTPKIRSEPRVIVTQPGAGYESRPVVRSSQRGYEHRVSTPNRSDNYQDGYRQIRR